jgi:hypothetical protein
MMLLCREDTPGRLPAVQLIKYQQTTADEASALNLLCGRTVF